MCEVNLWIKCVQLEVCDIVDITEADNHLKDKAIRYGVPQNVDFARYAGKIASPVTGGQCLRVKPGSSLCFKRIACIPVVVHIQHFSRVRQRLYPVCVPGLGVILLVLYS